MPTPDIQQHLNTQREDWNRVAPGWEKWDAFLDENFGFINHLLVGHARIRGAYRVLDIGSGTGYPALLAARTVGPNGQVVGIDLAEHMLRVAQGKAKTLNLKNLEFRTGSADSLSDSPDSYDAIISRFCLMFLPNIPKALGEISRVLKPSGYLSAVVWSAPEKNPYLRILTDVIKQHLSLPPPDPEAPGIFRLAKPGDLPTMLSTTGFTNVVEEEIQAHIACPSAEEYVHSIMDLAAPVQGLFAKMTTDQQNMATRQIIDAANQHRVSDRIAFPIALRLVTAQKPSRPSEDSQ